MSKINIYWSRRDFRLNDNPALSECLKSCKKEKVYFLPVFILEEYMLKGDAKFQFGYPSRFFLSKALPIFSKNFKNFLLLRGKAAKSLINISKILDKKDTSIEIFVNEDIYIDFYKQIKKIEKSKIKINIYKDQLTVDKSTKTSTGNFYSVFTPFKNNVWKEFFDSKIYKKINKEDLDKYIISIKEFNSLKENINPKIENINFENIFKLFSKSRKINIKDLDLDIDKYINFKPDFTDENIFYSSEEEAIKKVKSFIKKDVMNYNKDRDYLYLDRSTSKTSLALAWGLISSRYIKEELKNFLKIENDSEYLKSFEGPAQYISELIWREFYKYLFFNNPNLLNQEFQEKYRNKIIWEIDDVAMERFLSWIKGQTGYPIVDAAMLELAKTGYMHNRSRMIVSSILTKNLGVDWRWGQEYFRAMLIDLDEASNNGGWQWGASVGADPKPIRIFNPYLQAENFDKDKKYQKKWLPKEYSSDKNPILDHKIAREEALKRYGFSNRYFKKF